MLGHKHVPKSTLHVLKILNWAFQSIGPFFGFILRPKNFDRALEKLGHKFWDRMLSREL